MIELEGAADAERAVDEAKAALEELAVHLKLYGEGLENEGLDTFDAIGVNTMEKEVPGSAASRLGEAADLLARRPSEALPGRRPTRGRSNRMRQAHVAPAAFDVGQIGPRHPEQGGAGVLRQAPLLA